MFLLLWLNMSKLMSLMKNRIVWMLAGGLFFLLSSCLDTEEVEPYDVTSNCQIASFTLSSDSVSGLGNVRFTIDQLAGEIYNVDSMPYGTVVEKVLCNLTYSSSIAVSGTEVSPDALPDSTYWWNSTDSIDFSQPVKFVVHSYDGITTKVYRAWVNIHQVVPDSMVWSEYQNPMLEVDFTEQKVLTRDLSGVESYLMYVSAAADTTYRLYTAPVDEPAEWRQLSLTGFPTSHARLSQITEFEGNYYMPTTEGQLYVSTDGQSWTLASEGTPRITALLGSVAESSRQEPALAAIAGEDGASFYAMSASGEWRQGAEVPERFPTRNFAPLNYSAMYYEYLSVIGGRTASGELVGDSWATSDGLSWALMGSESNSGLDKREGVMAAAYDDQLFLIGGIDEQGTARKEVYRSFDKGLTWTKADSMVLFPEAYEARGFSSVIVDDKNYMNVFGGKNTLNTNELNQFWRGRIFRLVTDE